MSDTGIVRDIMDYPTSRDYRRLWELAQRQSVVCVVDWSGGAQRSDTVEPPIRDIASTISYPSAFDDGAPIGIDVSCRGTCYADSMSADGHSFDAFRKSCERVNLEWLVPGSQEVPDAQEKR